MAYATAADVQALNTKRTDYQDGVTNPSLTEVDVFIVDIASEIDTILAAKGLITPVASPAAFVLWLARLNALGAAAQAEMAGFPEQDQGQGSTPQGDRYWKMYQQGLESLKDGSAIHPDAPVNDDATGLNMLARSYGTDNPDPLTGLPPASIFSESPLVRPW